jgi:hypothetical protein
MAVVIMLAGIGMGVFASISAWLVSSSLLIALLAYPLGGTIGCLLVGLAVYFCPGRAAEATREPSADLRSIG